MSLDLESDYKKAKDQINSYKSYTGIKSSYDKITEGGTDNLEDTIKDVKEQVDKIKKNAKKFKKKIKNQLDQLLDIKTLLNGKGGQTIKMIKDTFLKTLKFIEPIIKEILLEEALSAVRCDLDQTYSSGRDIYIKVAALDVTNLLKLDPDSDEGSVLYEKKPIDNVQGPKFSMNKELYKRTQHPNQSFSQAYGGRFYKGASGQDLFDITFVQVDNFGITGPWFKITLKDRADGLNKVKQFLVDYYQSISIIDFSIIIANIMNALSGCISISANVGLTQTTEATKFSLFIQRILGLCFDNVREIDVSGNAKVGELDTIDESFFEFSDLDLITIEQISQNIFDGVVELELCDNVLIPVNSEVIIEELKILRDVPDNDLVNGADNVLSAFKNGVDPFGLGIEGDFQFKVDFNFIKKIVDGLIFGLLSPKVLLPIYIMLNSLGQYATDTIKTMMDFAKGFGGFLTKLISRIGAVFIKKLFEIISKDIKQLLQTIIKDLAKEQADIRIIVVLKLIQIAILIAEFIDDFRRCKSVIDEILWLLKIATSGWGKFPGFAGKVPFPLLLFSSFLDGASSTREFIGSINEMQKLGIPTGPMPDGSPNLQMLSVFGQMKASQKERAENGNVELGLSPQAVSPTRILSGGKLYGKYF